jgi:hypothetical protein
MKQKRLFLKAGILAIVLVSATVIAWEMYLRQQGRGVSYDDGGSLWADKRKQVYEPADKATVFIGSSRIKYDLDIPTWQKITGDKAIQLANVGSSALPILYDLADDPHFKGKLVFDVTEFLMFSNAPYVNYTPQQVLDYHKKETPAQKFSAAVNHVLESNFYLLDKEEYSLNALLGDLKFNDRPGVYAAPNFPPGFTPVTADRQNYMTESLVKDPNQIKQVTDVWQMLGRIAASMPPVTEGAVDSVIASVKASCDKIKARGGKVIFVRTPSSGPLRAMEKMAFPREKFWDKILKVTGCEGIHFEDFDAIAHFECPEFSHLSVPQAVSFTKSLINILHEKGWKLPSSKNTTNNIASILIKSKPWYSIH